MIDLDTIVTPLSQISRPRGVLLASRVNFDAVVHAPLIKRMTETDGTKFVVWVASKRRLAQWQGWLGESARFDVEEDIWVSVDAMEIDQEVEFATARLYEDRYGISYFRHVLHQDKGTAAHYLQHAPNSAFAKKVPRPFPRMVAAINLMFDLVEHRFDTYDIDLVIARNSGIFNSVANAVARKRGVPTTWLNHLRTGKMMTWMEGPDHGDKLTRRVMAGLPEVSPPDIEEIVPPDDTQWALDRVSEEHKLKVVGRQLLDLTKGHVGHLIEDVKRGRRGDRLPFRGSAKNILSRRSILKYLQDIAEPNKAKLTNGPFALFLLHLDPEYTSSTLARDFNHLHATIQQMALSLPVGMRLVIKEHVWGLGNRDIAFYESLRHLPNVEFADHRIRSTELAQDAAFVATLAGTIAFEASLIGTPVIVFSPYVEYANFRNVEVVRNIGALPAHVARALRPRTDEEVLAARTEAASFREAQNILAFDLPELELSADGNMNRDISIDVVSSDTVDAAVALLLRVMHGQTTVERAAVGNGIN